MVTCPGGNAKQMVRLIIMGAMFSEMEESDWDNEICYPSREGNKDRKQLMNNIHNDISG